ncbi:uncharacterized protein LOC106640240 [Copidosoma floridanum]|uniref:uncharacterized protein LOC106640240 n=1 Tax=Copidosoma floridanum TaxID=29053 RepID=UPI000C6F5373|nr:uncharacterized protein LOC106640240 [Copidosoma floridanum]
MGFIIDIQGFVTLTGKRHTILFPNSTSSSGEIPYYSNSKHRSDDEPKLSCCILMLDIILKQMELQNIEKNIGTDSWICQEACQLLKSTNVVSLSSNHSCDNIPDCFFCESVIVWHQLSLQLLSFITPRELVNPPDTYSEGCLEDKKIKDSLNGTKKSDAKTDLLNAPVPDLHSVGGVLVNMPHFFEQIMTATVETVSEQLGVPANITSEKSMSTVGPSISFSDTNLATAIVNIDKPAAKGKDKTIGESSHVLEDFWQTSMGKFKFSIKDLPEQLQYTFKLFEIPCRNHTILHISNKC